jgi:hypothetical protein
MSTNRNLCCSTHRIPRSSPSPLLTTFLHALINIQNSPATFPYDWPIFKPSKPPNTILEFEAISPGENFTRDFRYDDFVPLDDAGNDGVYRQMYPEECFERVSEGDVQERWRGAQEWLRKDESLGETKRIGWKCQECGWS